MLRMRLMLLSIFLKKDLRSNLRLFLRAGFAVLLFHSPLFSNQPVSAFYTLDSENNISVSVSAINLDSTRLENSVRSGAKVEVIYTFRARMVSDGLNLKTPRTREIQVRSTGFRDIITDDYVLLFNGQEKGSFRTWEPFEKEISHLFDFPLGVMTLPGETPEIRYRVEVVYKKFVAPLNLLYLLPGKYISRSSWFVIQEGMP